MPQTWQVALQVLPALRPLVAHAVRALVLLVSGLGAIYAAISLPAMALNHSGRMTLSCHFLALGTFSPHCEIALGVMPSSAASAEVPPARLIAV